MTFKYSQLSEQANTASQNTDPSSLEQAAPNAVLFSRRAQQHTLNNQARDQYRREDQTMETFHDQEISCVEKYGLPFAQACTIL